MKRLEFLEEAREIACQQISDSSGLTDKEFEAIMESDDTEEVALYHRAAQILNDASYDIQTTLEGVIEFNS